MSIEKTVTAVSAYHNYKYKGILRREIVLGSEGDGFFLHARDVAYPGEFPRLSLNLFNAEGKPVASIRDNLVMKLAPGCVEHREGEGLSVTDPDGAEIFGYRVVRYQNVYVTELAGDLFDERSRPVIP